MLTKDEAVVLFEVRTRGVLAAAFSCANISPGDYWQCINGKREITMRDIGEISHLTGCEIHMQLSPRMERDDEQST